MKRRLEKLSLFLMIISITFISIPVRAITLKDYEDAVTKYTKELESKQAELDANEKKIADVKATISSISNKIQAAETKITKLQNEIKKSNKEIKEKKEESKKVIEYYQIEADNNEYLEYIFGADSVTDMIYRASIVEQMTEYNEQVIEDLKELIEKNKKSEEDIKKQKKELKKYQEQMEAQKAKIESDSAKVSGTMPATRAQIKYYKERVSYYKKVGCKSSDVIGLTCDVKSGGVEVVGANGFRFPVNGGSISQGYGNGHKGVDIIKGCGTPIHAVASGKVYYAGRGLDPYGAIMVLIRHNVNGRLVFSQYAHLQSVAVSAGQSVSGGQTIGYMGTTGWSTGCHLHLEMSEDIGWGYNDSYYYDYVRKIVSPFKYVPRP